MHIHALQAPCPVPDEVRAAIAGFLPEANDYLPARNAVIGGEPIPIGGPSPPSGNPEICWLLAVSGEIIERLAGVEDFPLGVATYKAANAGWPSARVAEQHPRGFSPYYTTPSAGHLVRLVQPEWEGVMTINGFDPLAENLQEGASERRVIEEATKREVLNILKSYTGYYDAFSEMIQNALDALDEAQRGNTRFVGKLWIKIDLRKKQLTVIDNGVGMNLDQFKLCFRPSVSYKRRHE